MAERRYYVSWADKRTDPFPQHELIPGSGEEITLRGSRIRLLPADHPEWPGLPLVEGGDQLIADSRMGQYRWPGLNYPREKPTGRLYLGPTLSALFHPQSSTQLGEMDRVYLLHPASERPDRLEKLAKALARARSRSRDKLEDRITLVPIEGIDDPTNHEAILKGIEEWARSDPFDFGRKAGARVPARITIRSEE